LDCAVSADRGKVFSVLGRASSVKPLT